MKTTLKFDREELARLVEKLPTDEAMLVLVKDDGIYLMSFDEPKPSTNPRTIVYARGFDPRRDGDIWDKCQAAVGGDDIGEDLATRREFREVLAASVGDVLVDVTASQFAVRYSPKPSNVNGAASGKVK